MSGNVKNCMEMFAFVCVNVQISYKCVNMCTAIYVHLFIYFFIFVSAF